MKSGMSNSQSTLSGYTYHVPPAYSFAKSRRYNGYYKTPGPADYSPTYRYSSPSYSVSRSRREGMFKSLSPGPGHYNYTPSQLRYRYSIGKALFKDKPSILPGPGYYSPNVEFKLKKMPKYGFSSVSRYPKERSNTPAPGQYYLPAVKRGPSFTIAKARKEFKQKLLPGPGDYYIPSTIGVASLKTKPQMDNKIN